MKKNLKSELSNLLTGSNNKKDLIFVASSQEPGVYEFDGKTYNSSEFEELTKGYSKVVVFTPFRPCIQVNGKVEPITGMQIIKDE
jgi:hypothetical protein